MFNRVGQQDIVTTHNIRDYMSRSKKHLPITCWAGCKSQKRGKQMCNRKFRRRERMSLNTIQFEKLPLRTIEVMDPWDLGGDGKTYYRAEPSDEWYIKLMRK